MMMEFTSISHCFTLAGFPPDTRAVRVSLLVYLLLLRSSCVRGLLLGSWLVTWAQIVVLGTVTSSDIVMDTDDLERLSASVRRVDTICVKNWTCLCAVDVENGHPSMTKGFDTARREGTVKGKLRSSWYGIDREWCTHFVRRLTFSSLGGLWSDSKTYKWVSTHIKPACRLPTSRLHARNIQLFIFTRMTYSDEREPESALNMRNLMCVWKNLVH